MIPVDTENFVRAETNRMLVGLQAQAGGVNRGSITESQRRSTSRPSSG